MESSVEDCVEILIVDDERDIREMVKEVLEDEGYAAVTAANGVEAWEYLTQAQNPPCLILLDLMMPVMNGWELAERLQGDPAYARIPVVVLTADAHAFRKAQCVGARDFLYKPISLDALFDVVARYTSDTVSPAH